MHSENLNGIWARLKIQWHHNQYKGWTSNTCIMSVILTFHSIYKNGPKSHKLKDGFMQGCRISIANTLEIYSPVLLHRYIPHQKCKKSISDGIYSYWRRLCIWSMLIRRILLSEQSHRPALIGTAFYLWCYGAKYCNKANHRSNHSDVGNCS